MDANLINRGISCFNETDDEYEKLQTFMWDFNAHSPSIQLTIGTTMFDAGQHWSWTTLLAHDPWNQSSVTSQWQMLCPRDQAIVIFGTDEERWELRDKLIAKYATK